MCAFVTLLVYFIVSTTKATISVLSSHVAFDIKLP